MPERATCDQCNESLAAGTGFLFFSPATIGPPGAEQEVGNMLLCPACTDQVVTTEAWATPAPATRVHSGAAVLDDPSALKKSIERANRDSIVLLCRRHGLTPDAAKATARDLAQRWWKDPEKEQASAAAFWRVPPKRIIAGTCECGQRWRIGNNFVGRRVHCAKCSRAFMVPDQGDGKPHDEHWRPMLFTEHDLNWIVVCEHCGVFSEWDLRTEYGASFTLPLLARCPGCQGLAFPRAHRLEMLLAGAFVAVLVAVGVFFLLRWLGVF